MKLDGRDMALLKCDLPVHDLDGLNYAAILPSHMLMTRYLDAQSILLMTSGLPSETGTKSTFNE